jgi:hypothetical protein
MMVGGNIRGYTRTMMTTIALETSKGHLALALALGLILISLALAVSAAAFLLARRSSLPPPPPAAATAPRQHATKRNKRVPPWPTRF